MCQQIKEVEKRNPLCASEGLTLETLGPALTPS